VFNSGPESLNFSTKSCPEAIPLQIPRDETPTLQDHPKPDTDVQRLWQCGSQQQDPQWCTFDCQNMSRPSGLEDSFGTVTTKVHQTAVTGSGDFQELCDESPS